MTKTGPSPLERIALVAGALALPAAGVLALLAPEAPSMKGGGWQAPGAAEFLVFLAGALLITATARTVARGWRARGWPRTGGVISEVREAGGPYLFVRCRYEVDGAPYELEAVRYGVPRLPRVRTGDTVRVHYDPTAPSEADLHPVVSAVAATVLGLGLVVLTFGAFSLA